MRRYSVVLTQCKFGTKCAKELYPIYHHTTTSLNCFYMLLKLITQTEWSCTLIYRIMLITTNYFVVIIFYNFSTCTAGIMIMINAWSTTSGGHLDLLKHSNIFKQLFEKYIQAVYKMCAPILVKNRTKENLKPF